LVFDLQGKMAHFRRPDTTGTHATYPFITRTVLQGLIASILGMERLTGNNWVGIQLLSPVHTSSQEMSMLGKGWLGEARSTFNRPTSVELVISPHYRVYYTGTHLDRLGEMLREGKSHYHTYLGSAYCLVFPRFTGCYDVPELNPGAGMELVCKTVVPSHVIEGLIPVDGAQYGRVGGMHYEYLGERRFSGTVNVIYETVGQPVVFRVRNNEDEKLRDKPVKFFSRREKEVVVLW